MGLVMHGRMAVESDTCLVVVTVFKIVAPALCAGGWVRFLPSPPTMKPSRLRAIPSVDRLLQSLGDADLPRPIVVDTVRREKSLAIG